MEDKKIYYFDSNATTFMPEVVVKTFIKWSNKGNASANYCSNFRNISNLFKETLLKDNNLSDYTIVYTSGASESNAFIITSSIRSYMNKTGHLPHIIISEIEHKSIILCCEQLEEDGLCHHTKLKVRTDEENYGTISPIDLQNAIRPNTCLVSIMTANNETGIINDIPQLASIAHKNRIPFHSDIVQYFGKFGIYNGLDACSISFHKLSGPPGVGLCIIRNNFLDGYQLKPIIPGTQNNGLRGGTENIPGIIASYAAYKYNSIDRNKKNNYLLIIKKLFMSKFNKYFPCFYITDFENEKYEYKKIFWISNKNNDKMLPNTILLSYYDDNFCNILMKNELLKRNIIVSIGSACNTSIIKSSNVIYAHDIPKDLRSGVLRISFLDDITENEINYLIESFIDIINSKTAIKI